MKKILFISTLFLSACVTINIYFPAAAAEKVADEIIQEIQTEQPNKQQGNAIPQSGLPSSSDVPGKSEWQVSFFQVLDQAIAVIISPAHAGVNLSVDTVEIRRIKASMHARFSALKRFYSQGVVAIKADGFLTTRGNVPLKDRNKVNKLVAAENSDRNKLYQAIANANGHPEWYEQIKSTFASRWVSHAHSGWWCQSPNGHWKQK